MIFSSFYSMFITNAVKFTSFRPNVTSKTCLP